MFVHHCIKSQCCLLIYIYIYIYIYGDVFLTVPNTEFFKFCWQLIYAAEGAEGLLITSNIWYLYII